MRRFLHLAMFIMQTAVALLVAAGQSNIAGTLSRMYLPQYLTSAFTMAVIVVFAVALITPHAAEDPPTPTML